MIIRANFWTATPVPVPSSQVLHVLYNPVSSPINTVGIKTRPTRLPWPSETEATGWGGRIAERFASESVPSRVSEDASCFFR